MGCRFGNGMAPRWKYKPFRRGSKGAKCHDANFTYLQHKMDQQVRGMGPFLERTFAPKGVGIGRVGSIGSSENGVGSVEPRNDQSGCGTSRE